MFQKKIEPVIDSTKTVRVDPRILEPCPLLGEDISINTFEDVLVAYSTLGEKYAICAGKHLDGVRVIKELGNIK
jgi:hypothetical protein